MTWQVNWKVWHWPWHTSSVEEVKIGFFTHVFYRSHFAGFGPFQFHWYGEI